MGLAEAGGCRGEGCGGGMGVQREAAEAWGDGGGLWEAWGGGEGQSQPGGEGGIKGADGGAWGAEGRGGFGKLGAGDLGGGGLAWGGGARGRPGETSGRRPSGGDGGRGREA